MPPTRTQRVELIHRLSPTFSVSSWLVLPSQQATHNDEAVESIDTMKIISAAVVASLSCANAFTFVSNGPHSFVTRLDAKRQPIMAGNWKMNPATEEEAIALGAGLTKLLGEETCPMDEDNEFCTEVVIFPPHPFLSKVKDVVDEAGITVGAQSIFFEDKVKVLLTNHVFVCLLIVLNNLIKGAYTGSVAVSMVKSIGCEYVLCGHSERRTLFNDDDEAINRKVKKTLEAGLKPILCIGETKEEYDLNIRNEVCAMQLSKDLKDVTKEQMKNVVIACTWNFICLIDGAIGCDLTNVFSSRCTYRRTSVGNRYRSCVRRR